MASLPFFSFSLPLVELGESPSGRASALPRGVTDAVANVLTMLTT